jgi:hypothetical protein
LLLDFAYDASIGKAMVGQIVMLSPFNCSTQALIIQPPRINKTSPWVSSYQFTIEACLHVTHALLGQAEAYMSAVIIANHGGRQSLDPPIHPAA